MNDDATGVFVLPGFRVVAGELEAAERELAHEVADVESVGGGIEAAIERDRTLGDALGQRIEIGAVGEEAAPAKVFDDRHCGIGE